MADSDGCGKRRPRGSLSFYEDSFAKGRESTRRRGTGEDESGISHPFLCEGAAKKREIGEPQKKVELFLAEIAQQVDESRRGSVVRMDLRGGNWAALSAFTKYQTPKRRSYK